MVEETQEDAEASRTVCLLMLLLITTNYYYLHFLYYIIFRTVNWIFQSGDDVMHKLAMESFTFVPINVWVFRYALKICLTQRIFHP